MSTANSKCNLSVDSSRLASKACAFTSTAKKWQPLITYSTLSRNGPAADGTRQRGNFAVRPCGITWKTRQIVRMKHSGMVMPSLWYCHVFCPLLHVPVRGRQTPDHSPPMPCSPLQLREWVSWGRSRNRCKVTLHCDVIASENGYT